MGSSTSPTPNGSAINSPSDASYTSRTSHTSTRTTSPATSSHRPSPLLPLNHLNRVHLEPTSNTLLELQTEMERNAFQSINMRRDKLIAERVTDGTTSSSNSQLPRSFQPTQPQRPGASLGSLAARGLTSNNWRAQQMSDSLYIPFGSVGSASYGHVDREPTLFPVGTQARMDSQSSLLAYPIIANYYDSQLDSCYAYCFDRGNGRYTRLIPADMLPPLQNIPALQQGCQGMIVVPTPHAFPANGRSSNDEQVILRVSIQIITT